MTSHCEMTQIKSGPKLTPIGTEYRQFGFSSNPSPLRPGHAHGFRLPSRAPGIAAGNGTAVGKGGERAWLLNGVSTYYCVLLRASDGGWAREFDFWVILPAGKVTAMGHGSGCSS